MGELTCPNCNVDVDPEELRRSNLCCPTCGHDMSDIEDVDEAGLVKDGVGVDEDEDELDDELDDAEAGDEDEDEEDEEDEE
jgi:hypothetical protein